MAVITKESRASSSSSEHPVRDEDSSVLPKDLLANIVDVSDDRDPTQHRKDLELREPTFYQRKPTHCQGPTPPFRTNHHTYQGRQIPPVLYRHASQLAPWQSPFHTFIHSPFQVPLSNGGPADISPHDRPRYGFVPYPQLAPHRTATLEEPLRDSHYSHIACDSPFFGAYTPMGNFTSEEGESSIAETKASARVVDPPGSALRDNRFEEHERETADDSVQHMRAPLTPQYTVGHDMEGKKLVIAVSESPTDKMELGSIDVSTEGSTNPDSPGPAFLSFMNDMYSSDELKVENVGDFELLPCLDDESGRSSPPMMPFLSQSPQLSWDTPESAEKVTEKDSEKYHADHLHLHQPASPESHKSNEVQKQRTLTLKPKSDFFRFSNDRRQEITTFAPTCQPLFPDQSISFKDEKHANSLHLDDSVARQQTMVLSMPPATNQSPPQTQPGMHLEAGMGREDFESNRSQQEGSRDKSCGGVLPKRLRPQIQDGRESFAAISQSYSYSPARQARAMAPPAHHFMPSRQMGHMGFPARPGLESPPISPRFTMSAPNSRGKCRALNLPVPGMYQGNMESAMKQPLPDFSALVNFPTSLRQSRSLPSGHRCCVMCGIVRHTCSRARNRNYRGLQLPMPHSAATCADDFVTIPTQNKGLCTICDITVWVVQDGGCQIKWCKGCKNFRQWAFFGEKGHATKCGRCRERQRHKYAKTKDLKKRDIEQNVQQVK